MGRQKYSFKKDNYKKARGGYSRLLDISCAVCGGHVCHYQKDGPGILKRLYIDRISNSDQLKNDKLTCPKCGELLGNWIIYQREKRPAYRMSVGAISKKIIKVH